MSNPTSNFNWQMPTNTDLVTDLPADFEVFGQAVDSTMADLKGGTTGQILSKATNADMDFTWIANDQGDITAVNVTSPITGGGTSGAVTVGIQSASTSQSGAVQLSDSTSTTSSVLAATPTAVKSAYDLANGAVAKSTVTTKGDLIAGTASATVARLAAGSNDLLLTAASGESTGLKWAGGVTTFTPVFTNFTLGNGGLNYAQYVQIGKIIFFEVRVTLGSTSVVGTDPNMNVPVTGMPTGVSIYNKGTLLDAGTRAYNATLEVYQDKVYIVYDNASTTGTYQDSITATAPFTWTTNDRIYLSGWYNIT